MEVYCTICCKDKLENSELLPAIARYKSERIRSVYEKSLENGVDFRILSGKYGLLRVDELIPWYDEELAFLKVPELISKILNSFDEDNITSITYFAKRDESWQPYNLAVLAACANSGVNLELKLLDS